MSTAVSPYDPACDEQMVRDNAPLIWSVVRRFLGRGVEADDLYQLGCIGFLKALRGFDPSYGTQLSTYAVPKIAGEIKRFLRDDGIVKVSRGLKEQGVRIAQARAALERELGREPRLSELSAVTGLDAAEIATCEQAGQHAFSLDTSMTDDGFSLADVLGESREEQIVEHLALREAMSRLPELMRAVVALRYFRDLTQQKTAELLGISQVQVSRLEKRAIGEIRQYLT